MRRRFRHPSPVSHRSFSQCLREVGDEVIHIFDADREAEETGGDAAGFAFLFREVGVCLGGRVGDETFYTAQTSAKRMSRTDFSTRRAVSWLSV